MPGKLSWVTIRDMGNCAHRIIFATSFLPLEERVNQAYHVPYFHLFYGRPLNSTEKSVSY